MYLPAKKRISYHFSIGSLLLLVSVLLSVTTSLQAQQVTEIFTDFGGYWRSSVASPNSTYPNTSHNVIAFKVGTDTFSTGVNNSLLTSKGVAYKAGNYKALPISSIGGNVGDGSSVFAALADLYDGVSNGFSTPLPSVRMKDVLTDGINGLDIGTGITNIPATGTMTYNVDSINLAAVTDNKPDILYTQIASPSSAQDQLYFVNSSNARVGNIVYVNWSSINSVGNYYLDLYSFQTTASCNTAIITGGNTARTSREIRMAGYKFSDFGITTANSASITMLIIKPCGQSDPAFVAYNADAFILRSPVITTNPATQIVCPSTSKNAVFSVVAGGNNLTYQWRKNGTDIAGATGATYTITNVTAADAAYYDVVVTNSSGSATSAIAYLNTFITAQPTASQKIATGNSVILSVSANNATGFQWKKGGVDIAGATSATYTMNPLATTDGGTYTVSVINSANSGCATVLSNNAVVTAAIILYSKPTGDINLPATWGVFTDGTGSKPVNFLRAEHKFVVANRTTANTMTNLTIAGTFDVKNGTTTIAAGTTLDVGYAIRTGTGAFAGSTSSALTVRGTSNLYFDTAYQTLGDLTIAAGTTTMLSALNIGGGTSPGRLNITGGTLALNGNKITLKSTTTTNTAIVTALGSGAAITYGSEGAFVVERFIPAFRAYRFMSAPATTTTSIKANWMEGINNTTTSLNLDTLPGYGTHITGTGGADSGFDATHTNNPSLAVLNNTDQEWQAITNSNKTLTAGTAYRLIVRGSRSINLNRNDPAPTNTTLRTTGTLATGKITYDSTVISPVIGNYSFIGNPYASPIAWSALTKSGISNSYYGWDAFTGSRGGYVSYNSITGTSSSSTSPMNENIQSGQGFFVKTTTTTPSLQFLESNKTSVNTAMFRQQGKLTKLSVQIIPDNVSGESKPTDEVAAVFDNGLQAAIGEDDSYKLSNPDENISINRRDTLLSIEGRPEIVVSDTLPLKVWQFRQTNYHLKFNGANFSSEISARLIDNYLKKESKISLSDTTLVPFGINKDSASSFATNRLSVVFTRTKHLPIVFNPAINSTKIKGSFSVFPNPASGNALWLSMNNMDKGVYSLDFYNNAGQVVFRTGLTNIGGKTSPKITLNKTVTRGNYKLVISKGNKSSSQIVMVQ